MRKSGMLLVYATVLAWICAVAIPLAAKKTSTHTQDLNISQTGGTHAQTSKSPPVLQEAEARTKVTLNVLTVGGSVSHGWDDKIGGGFLHRTFVALNAGPSVTYAVYDKTIVGANEVQLQDTLYKGDYEKWLFWFQPKVVVLAWGLLNDCLPKTPMPVFDKYIKLEINEALQHKAVVFVVTPPVTRASYTKYRVQEQAYVDEEIHIVKSMNNPNVKVFNIFNEMKQYLIDHHQTYVPYMSNGWHPNSAGHALASRLLIQDIRRTYGFNAPEFKPGHA